MWHRASNRGQQQGSNDGLEDNNNKTTINKYAVADVEDACGWQEVTDKQQCHNGQEMTVHGGGQRWLSGQDDRGGLTMVQQIYHDEE